MKHMDVSFIIFLNLFLHHFIMHHSDDDSVHVYSIIYSCVVWYACISAQHSPGPWLFLPLIQTHLY